MENNNLPTPAQCGRLTCDYEALLYEELDEAREIGAIHKEDALKALISEEVVGKAVHQIPNRRLASKAIDDFVRNHNIAQNVKDAIDGFLEAYGVELDYDEMREKQEARIQASVVHRE